MDLLHRKSSSELTPKLSETVVYWTPSTYPGFIVGSPIGFLSHKYQGWLLVWSMIIHKSKMSFSEGSTGTDKLVAWSVLSSPRAMTHSPDWLFLDTDPCEPGLNTLEVLSLDVLGARHSFASLTRYYSSPCNCAQAPRQLRALTEHPLCTRPLAFIIIFNPY